MLLAFVRLCYTACTDLFYKVKAHFGYCRTSVQSSFFFKLKRDMLQKLFLVFVQFKLLKYQRIALYQLACRKPYGDARRTRMVVYKVTYGVQTTVYGTAAVTLIAKVLFKRRFLIMRNMHRMAYQLVYALVFGRRYGHHGHTEHGLHGVYIHRAAVSAHLIHHIQRGHRRYVHFKQLHCKIEISFYI